MGPSAPASDDDVLWNVEDAGGGVGYALYGATCCITDWAKAGCSYVEGAGVGFQCD